MGFRVRPACATALLFAALIGPTITSARAQDYPARPVEMIVPFAAGGGSELLARLISDGLGKRLGQPFVVLNRPGANTNLGTLSAVRSKPDGYTLLIASIGLAANPSLYKKLAFEPQSDLEPITLIANSPTVLAVPPSMPVGRPPLAGTPGPGRSVMFSGFLPSTSWNRPSASNFTTWFDPASTIQTLSCGSTRTCCAKFTA